MTTPVYCRQWARCADCPDEAACLASFAARQRWSWWRFFGVTFLVGLAVMLVSIPLLGWLVLALLRTAP